MIEINLIQQKKKLKAPVVLGVDLANLNFKMLAVAFAINFFAADYVRDYYVDEIEKIEKEVTEFRTQLNKVKAKIRKNSFVKDKLSVYRKQINKLRQRSEQVDKIIKERTNPFLVLEKIAKSAPQDLWFEELSIAREGSLSIKGGADTYQDIGLFINQIGTDPFFKELLQLKKSKTVEEKRGEVTIRVESFEVEGNINIYDPYGEGA